MALPFPPESSRPGIGSSAEDKNRRIQDTSAQNEQANDLDQSLRDRQLRAFFEGALDAMVVCDDEGHYLDVNAAACELLGLPREELLGQKVSRFVRATEYTDVWHQFLDDERLTGEIELLRADGTVREVEFAATANFLPHRHLSVMRDVTRRKQLERSLHQLNQELEQRVAERTAALQQSNAQLQAEIQQHHQTEQRLRESRAMLEVVLDNAIACIGCFRVFANGDWVYDYCSAGSLDLFGFSAEAVMADQHLWMNGVEPEDLEALVPRLYESVYAEHNTEEEYRFHHWDGSLRWIWARYASRYDTEAQCWRVTCVHTDISERKRSESQLRTSQQRLYEALESAQIGIWYWDLTSNIIHWSDTNYRLTGYEPSSDDKPFDVWRQAIHPEDWPRVNEQIQQALSSQDDMQIDYRVRLPDGSVRWLRSQGQMILDDNGELYAIAGIQMDMTEAQQNKAALVQASTLLSQEITRYREHENRFQLALEGSGDGLWDWTIDTGRTLYDQRWLAMLGYGVGELPQHVSTWENLIHPDDKPRAMAELAAHLREQNSGYRFEYRLRTKSGDWKWVETYGRVIAQDPEGNPLRMVGTHRDISDRIHAQSALQESEERFRSAFDHAGIGMALVGLEGAFLRVNRSFCYITGYSEAELLLLDFQTITHADDLKADLALMRRLLADEIPSYQMEKRYHHKQEFVVRVLLTGSLVRDQHQQPLYFIAQVQDITDRFTAVEELRHSAMHDALTDLPNRNLLMSSLEFALQRQQRQPNFQFAVLFLDLDRFKLVNDSMGHQAGDQLLKAAAAKILHIVRPLDIPARLGGDEFVILLDGIDGLSEATQIAERLLDALCLPFQIQGRQVYITVSIGIVLASAQYLHPSDLLRDADIAMYQAKAQGKNCYALFDPDFHTRVVHRMQLEHELRQAIVHEQFTLYYQPVVNLSTGDITGFEALVRWKHPELGLVPPCDFIPIAEETGLIIGLSRWILRTACEQLQVWRQQFPTLSHLRMNVNLSVEQLNHQGFLSEVEQVLHQTGLDGQHLTLEITETMLISNTEAIIELINQLQSLNIRVAIDDFGTGYSSLSYLHRLPINSLKVDKSFTQQMHQDQINRDIVVTILTLTERLGLQAVAEGIETADQLALLKAMGCKQGQGYYFARPLPAHEIPPLLARGTISPES
ncbi:MULTISPECIES: sensor domain-containing protein [Cyanophyceae]|uniref:PAS domain S-box protein n=1 Tax=Leptolyngbya subtilissima DQ-A4 TaxID=2933933 RepID=A0ABV0KA55_9CYAN|nr:PAS domain S-box protein [Nodosilinea sp. FACHB-141]MBD2115160.1 PAS domain S-box protein [Nodosilinea sp. FACHB-141]